MDQNKRYLEQLKVPNDDNVYYIRDDEAVHINSNGDVEQDQVNIDTLTATIFNTPKAHFNDSGIVLDDDTSIGDADGKGAKNLTITGNLTVDGDIVLKGDVVTLESKDVIIGDRFIELGTPEQNALTQEYSGLFIRTPTEDNRNEGFVLAYHNAAGHKRLEVGQATIDKKGKFESNDEVLIPIALRDPELDTNVQNDTFIAYDANHSMFVSSGINIKDCIDATHGTDILGEDPVVNCNFSQAQNKYIFTFNNLKGDTGPSGYSQLIKEIKNKPLIVGGLEIYKDYFQKAFGISPVLWNEIRNEATLLEGTEGFISGRRKFATEAMLTDILNQAYEDNNDLLSIKDDIVTLNIPIYFAKINMNNIIEEANSFCISGQTRATSSQDGYSYSSLSIKIYDQKGNNFDITTNEDDVTIITSKNIVGSLSLIEKLCNYFVIDASEYNNEEDVTYEQYLLPRFGGVLLTSEDADGRYLFRDEFERKAPLLIQKKDLCNLPLRNGIALYEEDQIRFIDNINSKKIISLECLENINQLQVSTGVYCFDSSLPPWKNTLFYEYFERLCIYSTTIAIDSIRYEIEYQNNKHNFNENNCSFLKFFRSGADSVMHIDYYDDNDVLQDEECNLKNFKNLKLVFTVAEPFMQNANLFQGIFTEPLIDFGFTSIDSIDINFNEQIIKLPEKSGILLTQEEASNLYLTKTTASDLYLSKEAFDKRMEETKFDLVKDQASSEYIDSIKISFKDLDAPTFTSFTVNKTDYQLGSNIDYKDREDFISEMYSIADEKGDITFRNSLNWTLTFAQGIILFYYGHQYPTKYVTKEEFLNNIDTITLTYKKSGVVAFNCDNTEKRKKLIKVDNIESMIEIYKVIELY